MPKKKQPKPTPRKHGEDAKGKYVVVNGKKCYTKEEYAEAMKTITYRG